MLRKFSRNWNNIISDRAKKNWYDAIDFGTKMFRKRNQLYVSYKASQDVSDLVAYKITCIQHKVGLKCFRSKLGLICAERTVANCLAR